MATTFERVRPGDVITSDLVNRILGKLEDLEQRLGGAGTGTTPVITTLDPPNEQVVTGRLTINGNFDTPLNLNTVRIDSIPIPVGDFLPGSDATKIIFFVPPTVTVPAGTRRPVVIRVDTRSKGSGERNYLLSPTPTTGVPNPNPTSISNLDNPALAALESTRRARITGTNLSPTPTVSFVGRNLAGAETRSTATVSAVTPTQIDLTVPNVPGLETGAVSVTVEVAITGAGTPGRILNVTVMAP